MCDFMLSKTTLDELKVILREEYGVETDDAQISEIATTLVGYFGLLSEMHNKDEAEPYERK